MIFFPWDEIHSLENKAEEALKQARTEDFKKTVDNYIDEVKDLFEMDYMLGVWDASMQLGEIVDVVYEDIQKAVDKKIDGKDYKERIEEYFEDGTPYDIARVISTDAHRIYNEAVFEAAKAAGASTKTWNCMMIPTSRDTHIYLDGTTVPLDAEFYTFKGNSAMFPGQFGVAEEDCNCMCWVTVNK